MNIKNIYNVYCCASQSANTFRMQIWNVIFYAVVCVCVCTMYLFLPLSLILSLFFSWTHIKHAWLGVSLVSWLFCCCCCWFCGWVNSFTSWEFKFCQPAWLPPGCLPCKLATCNTIYQQLQPVAGLAVWGQGLTTFAAAAVAVAAFC